MPITAERKKLYPDNWDKISFLTREKADWKCELCRVPHGTGLPNGGIVILTVHHINNDVTDNRKINLIALCQRCHLRLDMPFKRPRKQSLNPLFKEK